MLSDEEELLADCSFNEDTSASSSVVDSLAILL
jgi:hypothetical protein